MPAAVRNPAGHWLRTVTTLSPIVPGDTLKVADLLVKNVSPTANTEFAVECDAAGRRSAFYLKNNDGNRVGFFYYPTDYGGVQAGNVYLYVDTGKIAIRSPSSVTLTKSGGFWGVSTAHVYENTILTTANAGLTVEQAGTGDAIAQFLLTGVKRWVIGIDNSDGDKFKLARSSDVGTNTVMTFDGDDVTFHANATVIDTLTADNLVTSGDLNCGTFTCADGWNGAFTNGDGKTVTVQEGIITDVS